MLGVMFAEKSEDGDIVFFDLATKSETPLGVVQLDGTIVSTRPLSVEDQELVLSLVFPWEEVEIEDDGFADMEDDIVFWNRNN